MDIYDVLQRIVEARQFSDQERVLALKLLDEMRQMNAFGTMATRLNEADHECERKDWQFPGSLQCRICEKPMTAQPHSCVRIEVTSEATGWGLRSTSTKCGICGKGM